MTTKRSVDENCVTFSNVGGLSHQIYTLRQMVLLPLMYPKLYQSIGLKPPKGVLLHGPPGTGKTLVARAIASECCINGKTVTFLHRKGSDILSKYVGESEKKLSRLFKKARDSRPSIIFFDEFDGLAPVRSSNNDHIHASIVSILLANMDGITNSEDSGIVVIAATNRVDAIDSALRRTGRFDRELRFSLPNCEDRESILRVHTSKWSNKPAPELISSIALDINGYCGSDIQALCAEAVLCCLRRRHPSIVECREVLELDLDDLHIRRDDFYRAKTTISPSAHRQLQITPAKKLSAALQPLIQSTLNTVIRHLETFCHYDFLHTSVKNKSCMKKPLICPRLLITGNYLQCLNKYLAPALLNHFQHLPVLTMDLASLYADSDLGQSITASCKKVLSSLLQAATPAILYLPDLTGWWGLADEVTKLVFLEQIEKIECEAEVLILATTNDCYQLLASELKSIFKFNCNEVLTVNDPSREEREEFFFPLFSVPSINKLVSAPIVREYGVALAAAVSANESQNQINTSVDTLDETRRRIKERLIDFQSQGNKPQWWTPNLSNDDANNLSNSKEGSTNYLKRSCPMSGCTAGPHKKKKDSKRREPRFDEFYDSESSADEVEYDEEEDEEEELHTFDIEEDVSLQTLFRMTVELSHLYPVCKLVQMFSALENCFLLWSSHLNETLLLQTVRTIVAGFQEERSSVMKEVFSAKGFKTYQLKH